MSIDHISTNPQDLGAQKVNDLHVGAKKTVSFEPYSKVWTIDSYPQDLHDDLWYSTQEYQDIRIRNAQDIQEVLHRFGGAYIQFRPSQYRGLERTLDENRKVNIFRSIQAVLMEQDRQQIEKECHLDAVASLYQAYGVTSVEKAQRLAKMDAQDAQLAMAKSWIQEGEDEDEDDIVRRMESEPMMFSDISDCNSLQDFHHRRKGRWMFFHPTKVSVRCKKLIIRSIMLTPGRERTS
jgi:hypothetical protein